MTTMISEVYEAFMVAGAPEGRARRAAQAIAEYEERFVGIDVKLDRLQRELTSLQWMGGILIAGVSALIIGTLLTGPLSH